MKRAEIAFLIAVSVFAATFAGLTLSNASRVITWRGGGEEAFLPTAGKARDVDMEKLQRLLRQRSLSDREALYYREAEESPASEER